MEGVEERGRTLNPRDSVLGTRVSGLIGATDFSDLGITSDSRFGFLDLKFATSGEGGGGGYAQDQGVVSYWGIGA